MRTEATLEVQLRRRRPTTSSSSWSPRSSAPSPARPRFRRERRFERTIRTPPRLRHAGSRGGCRPPGARGLRRPRHAARDRSSLQRSSATGQRGWKRQPGRHAHRVRRLARQDLRDGLLVGVAPGHDRDQRLRVRVLRVAHDLLGRPFLDDPPQVHDRDPVGEVRGRREVVGDHEDAHPLLAGARRGAPGSRPAPRRRASRPARRRSAASARARARRRSRPAGAGRPRARAGSGR